MKKRPSSSAAEWDVFISHASEDKARVARPLAKALTSLGLKVWYDETALRVGNSLRREIDKGLANASFGVVVLSPAFFKKDWPQKELDGLVSRETDGVEVILPVWYNVGKADIRSHSPTLADKLGIRYSGDAVGVAAQIATRVYQAGLTSTGKKESSKTEALQAAVATQDLRLIAAAVNDLDNSFEWHNAPLVLVEALAMLLAQDNDVLKSAALRVCSERYLPPYARPALSKPLRPVLFSDNTALAALATKALARIEDEHAVDDLRTLATSTQSTSLKVEAITALVRLGAASGRQLALELARDGSDDSRLALLNKLADVPNPIGLEIAEQLALDPALTFQVRSTAGVLIAAETVNSFDEQLRNRLSTVFRGIVASITGNERGVLLERVAEWCQESIQEHGVGRELARILAESEPLAGASVGRLLGACFVLTESDHSAETVAVRARTWERVSNLPLEELEGRPSGPKKLARL
jgi:hypothetical protein